MAYTVAAVRRLVNIDPLIVSDTTIEGYADDGYTDAIDVAIALCDYMASLDSSATNDIRVGPISIKKSESSRNWQSIKDNLIKRKMLGIGSPGGIGLNGLMNVGGAVQTGRTDSQVFVGQFDNPPESVDHE